MDEKASKYWEKYLEVMTDEDRTDDRDEGLTDAYVFLSQEAVKIQAYLGSGEPGAKYNI